MGKLGPYRLSARETAARDVVPRIVTIGLSAATCAFGAGVLAWVVARVIDVIGPARIRGEVEAIYGWTVDAAMLLAALVCAWRPVPGTRSHVFARLAVVGLLIAVAAEQWPVHTYYPSCDAALYRGVDLPALRVASSLGRLVLYLSLAGTLLAAGRRFALPRWAPVVAAGFGATLSDLGLSQQLRGSWDGYTHIRVVVYWQAVTELFMLVMFAGAFAVVGTAVRSRPFVDEEARLPDTNTRPRTSSTPRDRRILELWRASMSAVLACIFAIASLAGEGLGGPFGSLTRNRPVACTLGLFGLFVLVERARRRSAGELSFALTSSSGLGVLCGLAAVFVTPVGCRELALGSAAITLGGIALLLPSVGASGYSMTKIRVALYLAALLLFLAVGTALPRAGSYTSAFVSDELPMLVGALFCLVVAVHLARPIERDALIAEARAAEESADPHMHL